MSDTDPPDDDDLAGFPEPPPIEVTEPGLYDIPARSYHADPCPLPSLSRSVLRQIVGRSERHAYTIHPKLGGLDDQDGSDNEVQDYGTAAHSAFLQGHSTILCLNFKNWATKAAKAARKQAYAEGYMPLLPKSYSNAMRLLDVLEEFRARTGAFTEGKPERTVVWREGAIWCRALVDWVPDDPEAAPWDLKTTAGSAIAGVWSRAVFEKGYDLQDSFYCRGLETIRGEPPQAMKFCVVEQKPPFGLSVFEMSPITRELADEQVRTGINLWSDSMASGQWPCYPIETQMIDPPAWIVRDRQTRAMLSGRNVDLLRGRDHPNAAGYVATGNFGG